MSTPPALVVADLGHGHGSGDRRVEVLHGVSFDVAPGEVVVLRGASGSGKTTACHLAAGIGRPDHGTVRVGDRAAHEVTDWAVIALVPQQHGLLVGLSVADNIALPAHRAARRTTDVGGRVAALAAALDLGGFLDRATTETSLGEQQRTAVARALVLAPRLAVLDEPTAHQDDDHVDQVLEALRAAAGEGTALLVASHEPRVWDAADRVLGLHEGRLVD